MPSDFDPFKGTTGLPDDFDMIVKAAWFEFDPEYNSGQTLVFKMDVETDDRDFGDGGVGMLQFSCGKGWESNDRGETAVREDGTNKMFHQSTSYQIFITDAIKCDGAEKVLRSAERGDPRLASMWVGTGWHLNNKVINYGGEIGERNKLVPTKFLGVGTNLQSLSPSSGNAGGASGGPAKAATPVQKAVSKSAAPAKAVAPVKKAASTVAATAAAPASAAETAAEQLTPGSPLWDELYAIAMASDDHAAFVERAFNEVAGVADDEAVGASVMEDGEGSVWAKAVEDYAAANS